MYLRAERLVAIMWTTAVSWQPVGDRILPELCWYLERHSFNLISFLAAHTAQSPSHAAQLPLHPMSVCVHQIMDDPAMASGKLASYELTV